VGHRLRKGRLSHRPEAGRLRLPQHATHRPAVTNLVNAGVPAHEAMAVSGHRTRSVFDRYSLTLKDQTKKALRQVSAYTEAQDATPTVIPVHTQVHMGGTDDLGSTG